MLNIQSKEARQLLHNKFVVILGDSIQRTVYKDLVQLLQRDSLLSPSQMKTKGELSFENDHLIEGGLLGELHNGTHYREVRQYRTHHHLVRFYFITRVYSEYLESILNDFLNGPQPDILVLNSCVWDISRYGPFSMEKYRMNLETVFNRLDATLSPSCLVIWSMTMPLGCKITGGFLGPEGQHLSKTLRGDIIQGNFYGAALASFHLFDVLDLHFQFRFDLGNRVKDGVHWNNLVHRRITNLLLAHLADAWGVIIPDRKSPEDPEWDQPAMTLDLLPARPPTPEPPRKPGHHRLCRPPYPTQPVFHEDSFFTSNSWGPEEPFSGFSDLHFPPLHQNAVALNASPDFRSAPCVPRDLGLFSPYPFHEEQSVPPQFSHRDRTVGVVQHSHGFVMRRRPFHLRDDTPYRRACDALYRRY
ncbi:PC-esterase domain-containing protein 1A [Tiliqua scincoides]|uniref:PC-esterase domain-containing protein 1A n=1 Tax=Tiliqua scincoides TaxID=71010 RepID=UPI0034618CB5